MYQKNIVNFFTSKCQFSFLIRRVVPSPDVSRKHDVIKHSYLAGVSIVPRRRVHGFLSGRLDSHKIR